MGAMLALLDAKEADARRTWRSAALARTCSSRFTASRRCPAAAAASNSLLQAGGTEVKMLRQALPWSRQISPLVELQAPHVHTAASVGGCARVGERLLALGRQVFH